MSDIRVKVIKNTGDFDRALRAGFAVNLFECRTNEMWLVLPSGYSQELAERAVADHKFERVIYS